jgi:hypothetical protein
MEFLKRLEERDFQETGSFRGRYSSQYLRDPITPWLGDRIGTIIERAFRVKPGFRVEEGVMGLPSATI